MVQRQRSLNRPARTHALPHRPARRSRPGSGLAWGLVGLGVGVTLALLAASTLYLGTSAPSGGTVNRSGPISQPTSSGSLVGSILSILNTTPKATLSPQFWGADARAYYGLGASEAAVSNATGIHFFRYPGGAIGDQYNYTANKVYADNGSYFQPALNVTQFIAWCRTVSCHAIFQLPGEINSPATAAFYVNYIEKTLGFKPDYYEIGNEPVIWTHYNTWWTNWQTSQNTNTTPMPYAHLVQAYSIAIRNVDPNAHIIGLSGLGTGSWGEATWINATVQVNGPNISAVSIHVYPAGGNGPGGTITLGSFYNTLNDKSSIARRVPIDRAAILGGCPKCKNPIGIIASEVGSGNQGGVFAKYMGSFANAPFLAAEYAQAINVNLTSFDVYAFESNYSGAILNVTGQPTAVTHLFDTFLPHIGSIVYPTALVTNASNFYALTTRNVSTGGYSLFVVNANASTSFNLNLTGSGLPLGRMGTVFTWNVSTGNRAPATVPWTSATPREWKIPAESLFLLALGKNSGPLGILHGPMSTTGSTSIYGELGLTTGSGISNGPMSGGSGSNAIAPPFHVSLAARPCDLA